MWVKNRGRGRWRQAGRERERKGGSERAMGGMRAAGGGDEECREIDWEGRAENK